jgi:hypothetical protein
MSSFSVLGPPDPANVREVVEIPLSRGRLVLGLKGNPARWVEPTLKTLGELLTLSPNWNSYGARPIDLAMVGTAWQLLTTVMRDDSPPPTVTPTVKGGIQFEWHTRRIDLEIETLAPQRFGVLFEDLSTGESWERELEGDPRELIPVVALLSERVEAEAERKG